jgi:hypothetical protein
MRSGRGNLSTRTEPAQVPFCPPYIPLDVPGMDAGRRDGKPATDRMSYGRPNQESDGQNQEFI